MHISAIESFLDFKKNYLNNLNQKIKIIEIGSQSINDSIKKHLSENHSYIGVDIENGENVDVVLEDPYKLPFENESIVVQLDKFNGSTWNNFGFSPYKWMRTDISLIYSTSALTFKIKASEIPKLRTSFIAYTGQRRRLQKVLDESHFVKRNVNNYEAYIPLKSLVGHTEFRWDELKEVRFIILNDIPFEIGDFKIIEFRGNPKKPTEWKGI